MKPFFKEIVKLSPDFPEDLVIFQVRGSLSSEYLPDFFRELKLHSSRFKHVLLDMSEVITISPSTLDNFVRFNRQLVIRDQMIILIGIPDHIFEHQLRRVHYKNEFNLFKTVDDALESLGLNLIPDGFN